MTLSAITESISPDWRKDRMNRAAVPKGSYGYILSGRKTGVLRTCILAGFCVGIFLLGLAFTRTNRNVFSIIAALGCIPVGLSAVNMILFLRAKPCSEKAYQEIEAHRGGLLIQYELEMTADPASFSIAAISTFGQKIAAYTEDANLDEVEAQKHLRLQIGLSSYHDYHIEVFHDLQAFCHMLDEMEGERREGGMDPVQMETDSDPSQRQTLPSIFRSISI